MQEEKAKSQVCENIRFLRKRVKGWTQQELADKLGIKRSLLGAYEESRADPRLNVLNKAAQLFGVTLEAMLNQDLSLHAVAEFPDEISYEKAKASIVPTTNSPQNPQSNIDNSEPPNQNPLPPLKTSEHSERANENFNTGRQENLASALKLGQDTPKLGASKPVEANDQGKNFRDSLHAKTTTDFRNLLYICAPNHSYYLTHLENHLALSQLPSICFPPFEDTFHYRAFAWGLVEETHGIVTKRVSNWFTLQTDSQYVFVTEDVLVFGRLLETPKAGGVFLLETEKETLDISPEEVKECWEPVLEFQSPMAIHASNDPSDEFLELHGHIRKLEQRLSKLERNK